MGLPGLLGMMSVRLVELWFHRVVVVMLWCGRRLFPIGCGLFGVSVVVCFVLCCWGLWFVDLSQVGVACCLGWCK